MAAAKKKRRDENGFMRDPGGKFTGGNRGGRKKGNPYVAAMNVNRSAIFRITSPEQFEQVWQALVEKGIKGDMDAIKTFLQYMIGPPMNAELMEELSLLEKAIKERPTLKLKLADDESSQAG